jgi:hypothetical protein
VLVPALAGAVLGGEAGRAVAASEVTVADSVASAVARGVEVLVDRQESLSAGTGASGPVRSEWPYEGVYRERGEIPIGYRIGGTAIAGLALAQSPGWDEDASRRAAVERAPDFVLDALRDARMSADFDVGYDVRGWGHAYALAFLVRLRALDRVPAARREATDIAVSSLVDILERSEIPGSGGGNYSRRRDGAGRIPAATFMTAPPLQALFEAASHGERVDAAVVRRALDALENGRLKTGAFQYAVRPDRKTGDGFEALPGAAARMAVCESTLRLAGRGSIVRLRAAIDGFFEHWEWLEKRRRGRGTHVPPYMIAPYYFFYAHYYVAQAIELLPSAERPLYRESLRQLLFRVREESGGRNDRVFERSEAFGTSMALLALLAPGLPAPSTWRDPSGVGARESGGDGG